MEEFVQIDWNVHKEEYVQLNIEVLTWVADQIRENYQLDAVSIIGQTIPEYVDARLRTDPHNFQTSKRHHLLTHS